MNSRISKIMTLSDAIDTIPDGAYIAIGGVTIHSHPMAAVREIVRQGRRNLTAVGEFQGIDVDLLAAGNCLLRIESAGASLESFGVPRNLRRAVESSTVEVQDYSDTMSMDRIRAAAENMTFWPVSHLSGSSIPEFLPDLREFSCPITGRFIYAMPPARIDVALIHAAYADQYGNVLFSRRPLMPTSQDLVMAKAAERVFVTVEEIIDHAIVMHNPYLVKLHSHKVTGVIEAPWGAHPSSMMDFYDFDQAHLERYVEASRSAETMDDYLREFLVDGSEADYLERVGLAGLLACRRTVTW